MKKIALLIAVVSAFSFASCKKDYTCTCTTTSSSGTNESTEKLGKMKLSEAKAECDKGDETTTIFGETVTTECTIK